MTDAPPSSQPPPQQALVVAEQVAVHVVAVPDVELVLQTAPGAAGDHSRAITGLHYRIGVDGVVTAALNGVIRIPYASVPVAGAGAPVAVCVGRTDQLLDPVDYEVVRSAGAPAAMATDAEIRDGAPDNRWSAAPPRLHALGYRERFAADWAHASVKDADTDRAALDFEADHPPPEASLLQRYFLGTLVERLRTELARQAGG